MLICEICLFDWYISQFCISDMSNYGYLEVFRGSLRLRDNECRLYINIVCSFRTFVRRLISAAKCLLF